MQPWMYPSDFNMDNATDYDLDTCTELPPIPQSHRFNMFMSTLYGGFNVRIYTNDHNVCEETSLFMPSNKTHVVLPEDVCETPLEYTMCPLQSSSPSCFYRCFDQNYPGDLVGILSLCPMLYLRIRPTALRVRLCELEVPELG